MCVICGYLFCPSSCPEYDPRRDPWWEDDEDDEVEEDEEDDAEESFFSL